MNIFASSRSFAILLALGALLVSPSLYADDGIPLDKIKAECARVQKKVRSELVPIARLQRSSCDAEQMYYELKDNSAATQADWNKVRACADSGRDTDVLMMMFYNGFGVKRDRDAALYYACEGYGPEFSNDDGMLQHIMQFLLADGNGSDELDTCDYAGVQLQVNLCAVLRQGGVKRKYSSQLDKIGERMTQAQKTAFAKLRDAVEGYASASGDEEGELNRGGSGNPQFVIEATQGVRNQFLEDIQDTEGGDFPDYSRADFIRLDRSLNMVYRGAMHGAPKEEDLDSVDGRLSKETLREAERAWLRYRDAWVAFARLRYPKVPAYVWKAQLTKRRRDFLANPQ